MKWIEFIGPSGVGKSFLFEKLLETRKSQEWITPEEGYEIILNKLINNKEIKLKSRIIRMIKNHFLNRKADFYQQIPSSYKQKSIDEHGSKFNFLSELMIQEFADSRNILKPIKKMKMISWYYEKRLLPFIVLYAGNPEHTIVFEDGILHNNKLLNIAKHTDQFIMENQVVYPDAIIFFTADLQTIYERIKHRTSKTGGTFIQRDLDDDKIRERTKSSVNIHFEITENMKSHKIPILKIDTTDNIIENCYLVHSFIRDLASSK